MASSATPRVESRRAPSSPRSSSRRSSRTTLRREPARPPRNQLTHPKEGHDDRCCNRCRPGRLRRALESLKIMLRSGPSGFDPDRLAAADTGEDLESWTRRTLGDNAYEYIVRPNMEMLYAVPPSDLSISFQLAVMKSAARFSLS